MSLWTELKRRNVFRVGAAYVVIGWLLLQVADIVLGFIAAPGWVGQALIALLLLGFVPVLALAWVFEIGPHGIRVDDGNGGRDRGPQARRLDVITLIAVGLVVPLMVWQHLGPALSGSDRAIPAADPAPGAAAPEEIYEAFRNLQGDHSALVAELIEFSGVQPGGSNDFLDNLLIPLGAHDLLPSPMHIWGPEYAKYRRSLEFQRYIRDSGIAEYWRVHGYPPQCRPIGKDDFQCD